MTDLLPMKASGIESKENGLPSADESKGGMRCCATS